MLRMLKIAVKKLYVSIGIFILECLHMRPWLVWDMDGCLANMYEHEDYMERLNEKKFFLEINAYYETIEALKMFIQRHPFYGIAICSKPMPNAWCQVEKEGWMNTYLPEVKVRMYVPASEDKSKYIKTTLSSKRVYFFDDYSANLFEMEKSKVCYKVIKVRNQINCKNGTWKGPILNTNNVSTKDILKGIEEML